MDMFDFRARNYMNPSPSMGDYGSNFNIASGAGPWATPNPRPKPFTGMDFQGPQRPEPTPYTGMEIQGPMRAPNSFAQAPPVEEPAPFRGMEVQGPLGSTPGRPNYEAPEVEGPEVAGPTEETPKEFDIFEAMYNAPTPALEAYKRHIMGMPKQEDYQAGKMDRFIAGLTGAAEGLSKGGGAGYAAARGIVDSKYNRALQNYANQGQGLGTLAELESNDMKSKMNYAKTMMEQRRADTKEAREGKRTDAEVAKLEAELPLIGKTIETSSADGQKYVVDKIKGTRTSLGKFDLTPEEKAEIERKTHKINTGVNLEKDKTMAGVNFGYDRQMEGIQQENRVGLFGLEEGTRHANRVSEHRANRAFDAANPIPSAAFDFTAPSQTKIAHDTAIYKTVLKDPRYWLFVDENASPAIKIRRQEENKELYTQFLKDIDEVETSIKNAGLKRQMGSAPAAPKLQVDLPGTKPIAESPISAPSAPETPERARAIQILKDKGEPVTPEMIDWVMKQPAFKVQ